MKGVNENILVKINELEILTCNPLKLVIDCHKRIF